MPFRRRRRTGSNAAIVAFSLLAYLSSVAPAAASVIYCISDDGHAGFELVASGERGCASCCHDVPSDAAHEGFSPEPAECTDIALSSEQAFRSGAAADQAPAFAADLVAIVHPPSSVRAPARDLALTTLTVPRNSPTTLLRHTVLLI